MQVEGIKQALLALVGSQERRLENTLGLAHPCRNRGSKAQEGRVDCPFQRYARLLGRRGAFPELGPSLGPVRHSGLGRCLRWQSGGDFMLHLLGGRAYKQAHEGAIS